MSAPAEASVVRPHKRIKGKHGERSKTRKEKREKKKKKGQCVEIYRRTALDSTGEERIKAEHRKRRTRSLDWHLNHPNSMDPKLYLAATAGDAQFLNDVDPQLLQSKAPQDNTALHIAARHGREEFSSKILGLCDPLLVMKNSDGDTPLHFAARNGYLPVVRTLVNHARERMTEQERHDFLRMGNEEGNTAVHEALRNLHRNVAIVLLEADRELSFRVNKNQESPLHLAVKENMEGVVKKILGIDGEHLLEVEDQRSLLRMQDSVGRTALHYAVWRRNTTIVGVVLKIDRQVTPYITDHKGFSPLHIAIVFRSKCVLKKLLEHCPDAVEQVDPDGRNLLHIAILNHDLNMALFLLQQYHVGEKLNQGDKDGNTPLHLAGKDISLGYGNILHFTLKGVEKGADLTLINKDNYTAQELFRYNAFFSDRGRPMRYMPCEFPRKRLVDDVEVKEVAMQWRNINMLVSGLIATVTFTAAITVPGGFKSSDESNPGTPILGGRTAFQVFMLFDSFAVCFSVIAMLLYLCSSLPRGGGATFAIWAARLTCVACVCMLVALATGAYLVVSPQHFWLAVLIFVLCTSVPFIAWAVWCGRLQARRGVSRRMRRITIASRDTRV